MTLTRYAAILGPHRLIQRSFFALEVNGVYGKQRNVGSVMVSRFQRKEEGVIAKFSQSGGTESKPLFFTTEVFNYSVLFSSNC